MPMKPLACSGPGELLHVDFMSIEEMVPLKEDPTIHNVLVLQDHFSKYVVCGKGSDCLYCSRDSEDRVCKVRNTGFSSNYANCSSLYN